VQFFYVYKALAHPEHNGYVQPFNLEERLLHVKEAQRTLGSEIPWICDSMDNEVKHALGDAPNSEFLIDPDGRVLRRVAWSSPSKLRTLLGRLVGPVENPTSVADLNLKVEPPPKVAARGVVPRLARPSGLQALIIEPQVEEGARPFYAKLRAEADSSLLRSGNGTLYVGFHMDPIYHVHWNNLTKPVRVEFEGLSADGEDGVRVDPAVWTGPDPEEPADIDPREFLAKVSVPDGVRTLSLKVSYFACNDEAGWCVPLTQRYTIRLQPDRDGGRARGGRPGGGGGRPRR
jgi:hypothetical protein